MSEAEAEFRELRELVRAGQLCRVAQHLLGVANTMTAAMSRMAQPLSCVTLPSFLKKATQVFQPVRTVHVMPTKKGKLWAFQSFLYQTPLDC